VVRQYAFKAERSLGRFYLVAVKDLPVAKEKYIKSFKMMDMPDP